MFCDISCWFQSNRILKIEGVEKLVNLEEFYISHNGIEKIEGLDTNVGTRERSK